GSLVESLSNINLCCTMGAGWVQISDTNEEILDTISIKARAQKRSNFLLTEKIIDPIKTNNIALELNKVKAHSNNKWNDLADKLAKKGCEASETIQVELGGSSKFQSVLFCKIG
ncbi:6640_t:CDS:2, partial [Gigaspora rosea]